GPERRADAQIRVGADLVGQIVTHARDSVRADVIRTGLECLARLVHRAACLPLDPTLHLHLASALVDTIGRAVDPVRDPGTHPLRDPLGLVPDLFGHAAATLGLATLTALTGPAHPAGLRQALLVRISTCCHVTSSARAYDSCSRTYEMVQGPFPLSRFVATCCVLSVVVGALRRRDDLEGAEDLFCVEWVRAASE